MTTNTESINFNQNNNQANYPILGSNYQPNVQTDFTNQNTTSNQQINSNVNQPQQQPIQQQSQNPKYFGIWGPELQKNR